MADIWPTIGTPARFTLEEAHAAADNWGANCGPGALAAVMGMTLDEVRPHMGDFEQKGYTNPTLMFESLDRIGRKWRKVDTRVCVGWPDYGLARIQWEGPWMGPQVPRRARYRHTHWVGCARDDLNHQVFDINAMTVGGWVPIETWDKQVVPWILEHCVPRNNGRWSVTHGIEVERPSDGKVLEGLLTPEELRRLKPPPIERPVAIGQVFTEMLDQMERREE